jgi:hypothetical protein
MNDDYDDFEDEPRSGNSGLRGRSLQRLIVVVAVGAFLSLAVYAYRSSDNNGAQSEAIETVEADTASYKEKPTDPGGETFPHKDKTIYEAIAPQNGAADPKAEKLLPEPEQPQTPPQAAKAEASGWVNADVKAPASQPTDVKPVEPKEAPVSAAGAEEKTASLSKEIEKSLATVEAKAPQPVAPAVVAPHVAAVQENKVEEVAKSEAAPAAPAPAADVAESKSAEVKVAAPQPTPAAKPAEVAPAPKTAAVKKPAEKPAPAKAVPAKPMIVKGKYMVQLGAYKSEAEAKQTAKRIAEKHRDILGSRPQTIVRADVNGATFYRLRIGGFSNADATKAACAVLTKRSQACFPAGK